MGEIEKNAGGYLGHLRLDEGGKNLNEDLCYGCGSPDHYKKYCPRKKASGGICGGNLCCCGVREVSGRRPAEPRTVSGRSAMGHTLGA